MGNNQDVLLTIKAENEASQHLDKIVEDVDNIGIQAEKSSTTISKSSDDATKSLELLGQQASRTNDEISEGARDAGSALDELGNASQEVTDKIEQNSSNAVSALDQIGISADQLANSIASNATDVEGAMFGMGNSGQEAGEKIAEGASKAGSAFTDMGNKSSAGAQTVIQVMGDVNVTLEKTEQQANKTSRALEETANKAQISMAKITTSTIGTVASLANMSFALNALQDSAHQTEKKLLAIEIAEENLYQVQNDSTASALDLALAQERVALAYEAHKQQVDKVNQANIQFGLSLVSMTAQLPQMISGLMGVVKGLDGVSLSAKLLQIAMGPVGWVLIGVSVAFGLFATNAGGLQDRIFELGASLQDFMDKYLKPLGDLFRWVYENAIKPFLFAMGIATDKTAPEVKAPESLLGGVHGETANERRAREEIERQQKEAEAKAERETKERERELEKQREQSLRDFAKTETQRPDLMSADAINDEASALAKLERDKAFEVWKRMQSEIDASKRERTEEEKVGFDEWLSIQQMRDSNIKSRLENLGVDVEKFLDDRHKMQLAKEAEIQRALDLTASNAEKIRTVKQLEELQKSLDKKIQMTKEAEDKINKIQADSATKEQLKQAGFNIHGSGNVDLSRLTGGIPSPDKAKGENVLRVIFEESDGTGLADITLDLINEEAVVRMKRESTII